VPSRASSVQALEYLTNASVGGANQALELYTGGGKLKDSRALQVLVFTLCLTVHHSTGGRRLWGDHVIPQSIFIALSPIWHQILTASRQLLEVEHYHYTIQTWCHLCSDPLMMGLVLSH
jgi:hypothetical protein